MIFDNSKSRFWRNLFSRSVLVLVTVVIIVWALPRSEGQRYRYDVGKPWMYGSFIASFDFPVYKTDETIKEQEDSLLETFQPYYNYDTNVEKVQMEKFFNDFRNGIPGLPRQYVGMISSRLHKLYQAGIMDTPEYNEIYKDSTAMIRVVNANSAQSIPARCFFSTLYPYEQMFVD